MGCRPGHTLLIGIGMDPGKEATGEGRLSMCGEEGRRSVTHNDSQ